MKIIKDEVIGELRYLTVKFDQTELVTGGMGVISQDAVKRYFIEKRPDLKVKKCSGIKLDSQRFIVTMRIGVVNTPAAIQLTGADGSKIEGEKSENAGCGDRKNHAVVALLNPGYDEVQHDFKIYKNQYDELRTGHDNLIKLYDELQKKYSAGVLLRNKLIDDLDETNEQVLKYQRELDALPPAYVELKEKYDALVKATGLENHVAIEEDSADLAAAKEVIVEDGAISLDVVEGEIKNG